MDDEVRTDVDASPVDGFADEAEDIRAVQRIGEALPFLENEPIASSALSTAIEELTAIVDRTAPDPGAGGTHNKLLFGRALTMRAHLLNRMTVTSLNEALRDIAHHPQATHLLSQAKSDWFEAVRLAEGLVSLGVAGGRLLLEDALNGTGTILMADGPSDVDELDRFDHAVDQSMQQLPPTWESVVLLTAKAAVCHFQYAHGLLERGVESNSAIFTKHWQRAQDWLKSVPRFIEAVRGGESGPALALLLKGCFLGLRTQRHLTTEALTALSLQQPIRIAEVELCTAKTTRLATISSNVLDSIEPYLTDDTVRLFSDARDAVEGAQYHLYALGLDLAPSSDRIEERRQWLSSIRDSVRRTSEQYLSIRFSSAQLAELLMKFSRTTSADEAVCEDLSCIENLFEICYFMTRFVELFQPILDKEHFDTDDSTDRQQYVDSLQIVAFVIYHEESETCFECLMTCLHILTGHNSRIAAAVVESVIQTYAESFPARLTKVDDEHPIGSDAWKESLLAVLLQEFSKSYSSVARKFNLLEVHYRNALGVGQYRNGQDHAAYTMLSNCAIQLNDIHNFVGLDRAAFLAMLIKLKHTQHGRIDADAADLWRSSVDLLTHLRSLAKSDDPYYAEFLLNALHWEAASSHQLALEGTDEVQLSDLRPVSNIITEVEQFRRGLSVPYDETDKQAAWLIEQLRRLEGHHDGDSAICDNLSQPLLDSTPAQYLLLVEDVPIGEYRLAVQLILQQLQSPNWHRDGSVDSLIELLNRCEELLQPADALDIVSAASEVTPAGDVPAALALIAVARPLNLLTRSPDCGFRAHQLLELIASRCLFLLQADCQLEPYVVEYFLYRADAALNRGASNLLELADRYQLAFVLYLISRSYNYYDEAALAAYHCCQLGRDYGSFLMCITWATITDRLLREGALSGDFYMPRRRNIEADLEIVFGTASVVVDE